MTSDFEVTLASILDTTPEKALVRAAGLKILPACGRCGGSGRYSWNQINGDVCFACHGNGQKKPNQREQKQVLAKARETRTDGSFDTYMDMLRAQSRCKNATDKVMKAWKATGISGEYRWQNAAEFNRTGDESCRRDREIADINKKMHDAYQRVQDAANLPNATHPEFAQRVFDLDQVLAQSLVDIADADAELKSYLESEGAK